MASGEMVWGASECRSAVCSHEPAPLHHLPHKEKQRPQLWLYSGDYCENPAQRVCRTVSILDISTGGLLQTIPPLLRQLRNMKLDSMKNMKKSGPCIAHSSNFVKAHAWGHLSESSRFRADSSIRVLSLQFENCEKVCQQCFSFYTKLLKYVSITKSGKLKLFHLDYFLINSCKDLLGTVDLSQPLHTYWWKYPSNHFSSWITSIIYLEGFFFFIVGNKFHPQGGKKWDNHYRRTFFLFFGGMLFFQLSWRQQQRFPLVSIGEMFVTNIP